MTIELPIWALAVLFVFACFGVGFVAGLVYAVASEALGRAAI